MSTGIEVFATEVMPIPLPTEVPPLPDLSRLPQAVLHSATVESLLQQNEDLMARLRVNIRRNSVLEGQLLELQNQQSDWQTLHQNLQTQIEILKEKDRFRQSRQESAEASAESAQARLNLLSIELTETQSVRDRLLRYRKRVQLYVRQFVRQLKFELQSSQKQVRELNFELEDKFRLNSDLKGKLAATLTKLQEIEKRSSRERTELVESYEAANTSLLAELTTLRDQLLEANQRTQKLDQALFQVSEKENQIIRLERTVEDLSGYCERAESAESHLAEIRAKAHDWESKAQLLEIEKTNQQHQVDQLQGL